MPKNVLWSSLIYVFFYNYISRVNKSKFIDSNARALRQNVIILLIREICMLMLWESEISIIFNKL
jgi:hypothetical protein